MESIRWFEAQTDQETIRRLHGFDHHQIEIEGEIAVLITYVDLHSPTRALHAVVHPAADRHPEVPARVKDVLARLAWEPSLAPRR